jgi:hypothetical protein
MATGRSILTAILAAAQAACHPAPAPAHAPVLASRAPDDAASAPETPDAGAPDDDAAETGEDCTPGDSLSFHVGGRDQRAHLVRCTGREAHHHGPDFTSHDERADLVLEGDDGVTTTIATWESGMEDTLSLWIVGALRGRGGDDVMLVALGSAGAGGSGASLEAFAPVGGSWQKVYQLDGLTLDVQLAPDGWIARVAACDAPAGDPPDPPTCAPDGAYAGDNGVRTRLVLRWNGTAIDATRR